MSSPVFLTFSLVYPRIDLIGFVDICGEGGGGSDEGGDTNASSLHVPIGRTTNVPVASLRITKQGTLLPVASGQPSHTPTISPLITSRLDEKLFDKYRPFVSMALHTWSYLTMVLITRRAVVVGVVGVVGVGVVVVIGATASVAFQSGQVTVTVLPQILHLK